MIIVCPSCGKNFNVRDDQIPDKGRLLQCSNCKHEWFYTKNTIRVEDNLDEQSNDELTQESFGILDEEENKHDEVIVEDKTAKLEKPKNINKKKTIKVNFFKILLVFIISFVAFVLIVDTFIVQISEYVPFAEKYLDNLYQSIIDISLFFQNLIK
ncbi:zinc-ribbon domain-containing protein [Candidatus Pelagibacter sp.]|nr:zinc-ribbon domain-containing protein [Candidatus Pelagibacter sp.]